MAFFEPSSTFTRGDDKKAPKTKKLATEKDVKNVNKWHADAYGGSRGHSSEWEIKRREKMLGKIAKIENKKDFSGYTEHSKFVPREKYII
jgi:hypothetical protein